MSRACFEYAIPWVVVLQFASLVEMEAKHRCQQALTLGWRWGGLAKLFAQEWEGDVTIIMPATLAQVRKHHMCELLSPESLLKAWRRVGNDLSCAGLGGTAAELNCSGYGKTLSLLFLCRCFCCSLPRSFRTQLQGSCARL